MIRFVEHIVIMMVMSRTRERSIYNIFTIMAKAIRSSMRNENKQYKNTNISVHMRFQNKNRNRLSKTRTSVWTIYLGIKITLHGNAPRKLIYV